MLGLKAATARFARLSALRAPALRPARRALHSSATAAALKPYLLADIGEGIKECEVIQWFVEPGARIDEFDKLCEVQSDKASVEITSRYTGVIKKLYYDVGEMAIVGTPIVDIDIDSDAVADGAPADPPAAAAAEATAGGSDAASPAVQQAPSASPSPSILATPAVRRVSRELGVALQNVRGTGKDGRILKEDVIRFSQTAAETPAESSADAQAAPLTPMQTGMFKSMTESLTIPHFLYTDEVCIDNLFALRQTLNSELAESGTRLSYMPFFIKAMSLALLKYPLLNAKIVTDPKPAILYRASHNIGIAIDTPLGLVVPNIKQVQTKSILEIASELLAIQEKAKNGKLTSSDMSGTTITLSNIGNVGGTYVAPVIVAGQSAIAGIGRSQTLPRYEGENIVPKRILNTSWSGDHRLLDGMTMARAVDLWKSYIEVPGKMLVNVR